MGALRKIAALTLGQPPALIDRLFVPRTEGGRNARVSADGAMMTVDIGRPLMILALALAGPPGQGWAQDIGSEAPPYCSDLLAMARERFAAITGKPREGNFQETSLALTGWNNCARYGVATYTCDSPRSAARKRRNESKRRSCGKSRSASVKDGPKRATGHRPTMWSCTTRSDQFRSRSARIKPTTEGTSCISISSCVETKCRNDNRQRHRR